MSSVNFCHQFLAFLAGKNHGRGFIPIKNFVILFTSSRQKFSNNSQTRLFLCTIRSAHRSVATFSARTPNAVTFSKVTVQQGARYGNHHMNIIHFKSRVKYMFCCFHSKNFINFTGQNSVVFLATCYWLDGPEWPWEPPSLQHKGYRICFTAVKWPAGVVKHPASYRAQVKERVELYLSSASWTSWQVMRWILHFYL